MIVYYQDAVCDRISVSRCADASTQHSIAIVKVGWLVSQQSG